MRLSVSPEKVLSCLLAATAVLTILNGVAQFMEYGYGEDLLFFDVDSERNLPTWYSSATLLVCSLLMVLTGWIKRQRRESFSYHWISLGAIFLIMSIDETSELHEKLSVPVQSLLAIEGERLHTWILVGAALVVLSTIVYWRFFFHLKPRLRWLFLLAGATYLGGALGIEMLQGFQASAHGRQSLGYELSGAVEECLEMMGVAVLIYALLHHWADEIGRVETRVTPEAGDPKSAETQSGAHQLSLID